MLKKHYIVFLRQWQLEKLKKNKLFVTPEQT